MDWTTVAVALLSGGSGVLGGYLGAGRQSAGDLDRLRAEYAEQARRERQTTYHQLLDHLTQFNAIYGGYAPFADESDYDTWVQGFHHLANGIRMVGSQETIDLMIRMSGHIELAYSLLPDEDDFAEEAFPPFEQRLRTAVSITEEKWFEQYRELVQAIRDDVGMTPASTSRRFDEL